MGKVQILDRTVNDYEVVSLKAFIKDMNPEEIKVLTLLLRDDVIDCPENVLSKEERINLLIETFVNETEVKEVLETYIKGIRKEIIDLLKGSFVKTPLRIDNVPSEISRVTYLLMCRLQSWDLTGYFEFEVWNKNIEALTVLKAFEKFSEPSI